MVTATEMPTTPEAAETFIREVLAPIARENSCTVYIAPGCITFQCRRAGWKANQTAVIACKRALIALMPIKGSGIRHAKHHGRKTWGVYLANDLDGAATGVCWDRTDAEIHAIHAGAGWTAGADHRGGWVRRVNGSRRFEL